MELNWIATPYGLASVCAVCVLAAFIVTRGVYWDKDDKVLKIGSGRHPRTLDQFQELYADMKGMRTSIEGIDAQVKEARCKFESTHNDIKVMVDALRQVKLDQQKQLFYDKDQRNGERLVSGLRYVEMGGNGAVKVDVEDFALEHRDLYDSVILAAPRLKLGNL
jgi:hypothetical protein